MPVPLGIFGLPNPVPIFDFDGPAIFRILARVLGIGVDCDLDPGFIVGFIVGLGAATSGDRVILVGIPRLMGVGLMGP